jgi:hypothetical protein
MKRRKRRRRCKREVVCQKSSLVMLGVSVLMWVIE